MIPIREISDLARGGETVMIENMIFASQVVDLSEAEKDDRYIILTNRLCYYDEPNSNNVILPSDKAEELAQSLIDMPVVAKYCKTNGKDDLGGHEMSINADGEIEWGTETIGVHKSIEIKDDTVEVNGQQKVLPCLFATSKIWTRNKHFVNAIKRLYESNGLFTSWEIATKSYEVKNGVKTLTDYEFLGNCCLGSDYLPAYGCASKTLNVASIEPRYLIAKALKKDIEAKDGDTMDIEDKNVSGQEIGTSDVVNKTEISTKDLTEKDIYDMVSRAYFDKYGNTDQGYIRHFFPLASYALFKTESCENELDFIKVDFSITDDRAEIVGETPVSLTIDYSGVEEMLKSKDAEISSQANGLVEANNKIEELKRELSDLEPIKIAYEESEKAKKEKEIAEFKFNLESKISDSGLFTPEEIKSETIQTLISELDETKVNSLIAERFLKRLKNAKKQETSSIKKDLEVEVDISIDESTGKFSVLDLFNN